MPRPLSQALCDIIKSELQNGLDLETMKSRHMISDGKARAMRRLFKETGEVVNTHKRKPTGRPQKLKDVHVDALKHFLAEHPEAFLKDMCLFMEITFGLELTESTMQRCCKRIGWSLKKRPPPRDDHGSWMRTLPRDEHDNPIRSRRPKKKRPEEYGTKFDYKRRRMLMEKTRGFVKDHLSHQRFDASHDFDHILRVVALSNEILRVEANTFKKIAFDRTIVELVALMHDVDDHKYHSPSDQTGGYPSPPSNLDPHPQPQTFDTVPNIHPQAQQAIMHPNLDPSLQNPLPLQNSQPIQNPTSVPPKPTVETHLLQLGWPEAIISKVVAITPYISYTAETSNKPGYASALAQYPELAIVQDADRLDAMGATGIARAFTFGGAKGREGGLAGTMQHFDEKLSKLEAMMKTGEGKRLSVVRAERLRIFGRWWHEEMRQVGMAGDGGMDWTKGTTPWTRPDASSQQPNPVQHANPGNNTAPTNQSTNPNASQHNEISNVGIPHGQQAAQADLIPNQANSVDYGDPERQLLEAIERSTQ